MKEYIRILGDEDLVDQPSVDTLNRSRKWQDDVATCTALPVRYVFYRKDMYNHIRSHHSDSGWIAVRLLGTHL